MKEKLTLQEATECLLEYTRTIEETEKIALWDGAGRVLAEDIKATMDQPPFDRSPLDGYAVRSEDTRGASREHPITLQVIDEVVAGFMSHKKVEAGTAIRIMTGAPIPEGADCIIMQENTDYGEETVEIYQELKAYQNYCFRGEDYKAGKVLLPAGTTLCAVDVGVIAGTGRTEITVLRKVRAAVFTTGDEVRLPGEELIEGKIYDNNLHTMVVQLGLWGADVVEKDRVTDDAKIMAQRIRDALPKCDVIITSGGVSVGKKDIMHDALEILGAEKIFWRVLIKPGMPTLCGVCDGKLILCLSGNPYGVAVNVNLLGKPVFEKLSGKSTLKLERRTAVMGNSYPKKSTVTRYIRACLQGENVFIADGSNDSGVLSNMCGCNCLIEVPAGTPRVDENQKVTVVML